MHEPDVSVVIPLYNKGPLIARALNSVLVQTIQNFEVIVVDDGSTDNGAMVVRDFDDPRILMIQQENLGVSAARNKGAEAARAEMIAFLDADDEWMPDHLDTLLELHKKHPDAGAYGTACLIRGKSLSLRIASYSVDIHKEPWDGLLTSYFRAAALGFSPITASTAAIPKDIFREMRGFNTSTWWGEDTDLWGRIALKYPIAFSWHGMGIYDTEAKNRSCDRIEPIEENIFIRTAMEAIEAGEINPNMRMDLLEYIANKQINTALHNVHVGKQKLARVNLKNCETKMLVKEKYLALFLAYAPPSVYSLFRIIKRFFF